MVWGAVESWQGRKTVPMAAQPPLIQSRPLAARARKEPPGIAFDRKAAWSVEASVGNVKFHQWNAASYPTVWSSYPSENHL